MATIVLAVMVGCSFDFVDNDCNDLDRYSPTTWVDKEFCKLGNLFQVEHHRSATPARTQSVSEGRPDHRPQAFRTREGWFGYNLSRRKRHEDLGQLGLEAKSAVT